MICKIDEGIKGIKPECKQLFLNQFFPLLGSRQVMNMKRDGVITHRDLVITKLIYHFNFATSTQVYNYLLAKYPDMASSVEAIAMRLDKLVQYRVLNKFILTENHEALSRDYKDYSNEALEIYCLDLSGRDLLANHSNEDTSNWYSTETMKSSEVIKKELFVLEFYIGLIKTCKDKIKLFNSFPEMRLGKTQIIPSFEFVIEHNGEEFPIVGEIVLDIDLPRVFKSKTILLETLVSTNTWKTYYLNAKTAPTIFFVAESDIVGLNASKTFLGMTGLDRFRVTTMERIQKNKFYEEGVFMKYIDQLEQLEEVITKIFIP